MFVAVQFPDNLQEWQSAHECGCIIEDARMHLRRKIFAKTCEIEAEVTAISLTASGLESSISQSGCWDIQQMVEQEVKGEEISLSVVELFSEFGKRLYRQWDRFIVSNGLLYRIFEGPNFSSTNRSVQRMQARFERTPRQSGT